MVRGFASTHLVKCSTAIAKNFKPPIAIDRGLAMLIPQGLNSQALFTVVTSLLGILAAVEYRGSALNPQEPSCISRMTLLAYEGPIQRSHDLSVVDRST
ncbi:hypothetical protein Tco_0418346, partial [Tanacetum coccineum]